MCINFRKMICKRVDKGDLLYKLCDCQRYEPDPVDEVFNQVNVSSSVEDSVVLLPKCNIPYHQTGKLLVQSDFLLTMLSTKDNALWREEDLPAYLDALVADGVNAIRSFCWFDDNTPEWDSFKPSVDGDAYWYTLARRLRMIKDRDLTAIVTMVPYQGSVSRADVESMVAFLLQFLPNVIIETENEPTVNTTQEMIVEVCKELGWPVEHIQLGFVDSGAFGDLVLGNPGILSCCHYVATMNTVNDSWAPSPGTMQLMSLGMYGSNDGEDASKASQGWYFYGAPMAARRPTEGQLYDCAKWFYENGNAYENLSASAFQDTDTPCLEDAITLGQTERLAMRRASGL